MDETLVPSIKRADVQGIVCVTLDIHLWSGRKRLRKEALTASNPMLADLPPESLATLGSVKIADPDDLSPFLKLKREAEKLLKANGLPLLGSVGIPEAKLQRVYKGLKDLEAKFEARRNALYADFDARITEWRRKEENRSWAHLIAEIPPPEYVAGRLSFGFHMCRVNAPVDGDSEINAMYGKQMGGLRGELFAEASIEAKTLLEKYLTGKHADGVVRRRDRITQKTLGPLRRVAEKLESFAFLDPTVDPLSSMVRHVLDRMPVEGPIEGHDLMDIWAMAKILSNTSTANEAAMAVINMQSPETAFKAMASQAQDVVDSPVVPDDNNDIAKSIAARQGSASEVADRSNQDLIDQADTEPHAGDNAFEPSFVQGFF